MTSRSRFILRLARWIAGRDRAEWVDAMAAEADVSRQSTAWATGCAWASFKDRIVRERRFFLAVLMMPIAVFVLEFVAFLPIAWLSKRAGLPGWTFIGVFLLLPLPFSFALGRWTSLRRALVGSTLGSLGLDLIGIAIFWISFRQGPEIWFERGSQVYNMTPILGWACSLSVWLVGAWAGSLSRRVRITL